MLEMKMVWMVQNVDLGEEVEWEVLSLAIGL